ncbi:NADH dehydrogenase 1 alpha subcomplex assembly factor 3 [Kickxella alabastrina]|uniref:NADH dehydrogenase 1 alpha subcomplex assembly factor 3 n=1 Tax=Kickxella alabastrina TaxID=61397 RepID=UPI00221E7F69|nr:NADH dehydrogenase 1 alpha subcomplex assembly factor 3 [Kickxella alabastrina]KAI7833711.1 NADH dehydrogenase 1 alpha subcomplex assembly factor 3 [Kickxella alabastrina]
MHIRSFISQTFALRRAASSNLLALTKAHNTGAHSVLTATLFRRNNSGISGSDANRRGGRRRGQQLPSAEEGGFDRQEDRFQYDMKEPLITESLPTGFRLNNGHTVYGPILIVNNEAFSLKIPPPKADSSGKVVNPLMLLDARALEVLNIVTPKPEMVVVGGGAGLSLLSGPARKYLTSIGINVELASTRYASSTFNTLSEEGRNAALLALPAGVTA